MQRVRQRSDHPVVAPSDVVVHVKGECSCLLEYKAAGHWLDPVDTYAIFPSKEVTHILVQTTVALADYEATPGRQYKLLHIPGHHTVPSRETTSVTRREDATAAHKNRTADRMQEGAGSDAEDAACVAREPVVVGIHSTYIDPVLQERVEHVAKEYNAEFRYVNPNARSLYGHWNALSPQATSRINEEIASFDISIAKPNCYRGREDDAQWRKWFCDRHHPGQRLATPLAFGIPTIAWATHAAHRDVAPPNWPLLVHDDEECVEILRRLLVGWTQNGAVTWEDWRRCTYCPSSVCKT